YLRYVNHRGRRCSPTSTSISNRTRAASPSAATDGRTEQTRTTLHPSNPTPFHIPHVTSTGPQSQPKLQAILRMKLKGPPAPLTQGRLPSLARIANAYFTADAKVTRSSLLPRFRCCRTSNRNERNMFCVSPISVPF